MRTEEARTLSGRLIMGGFSGTEPDESTTEIIRRGEMGGVTLFRRNIEDIEQVIELNSRLKILSRNLPFFLIGIDQEGGRVVRLERPCTVLPPARELGSLKRPDITGRAGFLTGSELNSLGFCLNFAPVLDISADDAKTVIGDRSYADNALDVFEHAMTFSRGLEQGGVISCAKHFPGHGCTAVDSHTGFPKVDRTENELLDKDIVPFSMAIQSGIRAIMTAHVIYEDIDTELPATLSPAVIRRLLRQRLKFDGVVFTDDLEMQAVSSRWDYGEAAVLAFEAGADVLLICSSAEAREKALERLSDRASSSSRFAAILENSARRLEKAYASFLKTRVRFETDWIGSESHKKAQNAFYSELCNK